MSPETGDGAQGDRDGPTGGNAMLAVGVVDCHVLSCWRECSTGHSQMNDWGHAWSCAQLSATVQVRSPGRMTSAATPRYVRAERRSRNRMLLGCSDFVVGVGYSTSAIHWSLPLKKPPTCCRCSDCFWLAGGDGWNEESSLLDLNTLDFHVVSRS